MTQITTVVWSLDNSQTSWNAKASKPLGSITMNKGSGVDGILAEVFQILKDDAFKLLRSICQQIWKTQQWPQDWKSSVFINPKERQCQRMFKVLHSCHMLAE